MTSNRLFLLRSHLTALRRARRAMRIAAGVGALVLASFWLLMALFLVDRVLHLSRGERAVLLAASAALLVWSAFRRVYQTWRCEESDLQLALRLEREHALDGDLVAALEFDSFGPAPLASPALAQAVIERVAAIETLPQPSPDPAAAQLRTLARSLAATAALAVGLAGLMPAELRIFANRILLGSARYPTRTVIAALRINGIECDTAVLAAGGLRFPYGRKVQFEIDCAGDLPEDGVIQLASHATAQVGTLPLKTMPRTTGADRESAAHRGPDGRGRSLSAARRTFAGTLDRLLEPLSIQVEIGDAQTDPIAIEPIELPAVALELTLVPPAYAAARRGPTTARGTRRVTALEGSRIEPVVRGVNKPLKSATLRLGAVDVPFAPLTDDRRVWRIEANEPALARLAALLEFEIAVVDDDGLSPEEPIRCSVSAEPDLPPRVAAAVVTDKVLPTAEPVLAWGAADDFGLVAIRLNWQIIRSGREGSAGSLALYDKPADSPPPVARSGRRQLPLAEWRLAPGDEIRLALEAVDDRGDVPGSVSRGDPVLLSVTDENGILAALAEGDERSARELDELIGRQLGIGGAP